MYRAILVLFVTFVSAGATSQTGSVTVAPDSASQIPAITLQEALDRAKASNVEYRTAQTEFGLAREDRVQARAALLPEVGYTTGAIYTEPNGQPPGRFISANSVHEYISQGVAREALSFTNVADFRRARAAEALARAKAEVATRGLIVTVIQDYYGVVVAQRKAANAKQASDEAQSFLSLSQKLEQGGEVAHSDVIKAQLQANDRTRDLQESTLAQEKARLALAVLVFPNPAQEYTVVDDLRFAPPLPQIAEVQQMAAQNNPELKAALAAASVANHEVFSALGGHLPSLSINYFYGIDAPNYAVRSDGIRNLGYQVAATLDLPIWNWGATQSKVKQARLRQQQAQVELTAAQRQAIANLRSFYSEAEIARAQLDLLRQSTDLAAESMRLTTLRYQGGEATALEVVDAQNALIQARNNYDDGEVRYRVAVANLQTLTGKF